MIKEHNKAGNKKTDRRKEKKIRIFSPSKIPVYFLCSAEKKLTRDQKSGRVTSHRYLLKGLSGLSLFNP